VAELLLECVQDRQQRPIIADVLCDQRLGALLIPWLTSRHSLHHARFLGTQLAPPTRCIKHPNGIARSEFPIVRDQDGRLIDQKILVDAPRRAAASAGSPAFEARAKLSASRRASATSAAISGVIGSRCGTTRPTSCVAAGSTIGMDRTLSVRPSVSASFDGMMLAHLPVRTWANSTIIEFDSSVGDGSRPAL